MIELPNEYGIILIGKREELFMRAWELIVQTREDSGKGAVVGLSGGSTPRAFFEWAVAQKTRMQNLCRECRWTVSDERCVPLDSEESNFGTANRHFLLPLNVPETNKMPWPVDLSPALAAKKFRKNWSNQVEPQKGLDLCFLGLGEDCHTASLFPDSPLVGPHENESFAAVDVPTKGWRLTITETGLDRCRSIVVMVTGSSKAKALARVFREPSDPSQRPAQVLGRVSAPVIWLVDSEAASVIQ